MTTYFGLCDASGNPSNTDADNDGGSAILLANHPPTQVFTCPGSGAQTVTEISADVSVTSGSHNIRCAIYDATGATKIAEGTAAVAVVGTSDNWNGHIGQANITPNPCTLVGGTNYILAVASGGGLKTAHAKNVAGNVDFKLEDDTGGMPANLTGVSNSQPDWPVRVGLLDQAIAASIVSPQAPGKRMISYARRPA